MTPQPQVKRKGNTLLISGFKPTGESFQIEFGLDKPNHIEPKSITYYGKEKIPFESNKVNQVPYYDIKRELDTPDLSDLNQMLIGGNPTPVFQVLSGLMGIINDLNQKLNDLKNQVEEQQGNQKDEDELMNVQQAAEFLNYKVSTIRSKVHRKELPYSKIGNKVFFSKKRLLEHIRSREEATKEETIKFAGRYLKEKLTGWTTPSLY
jgi:excisionase family DNA binding protein